MTAPNEIWTADFKGHFKTRNGLYCYPLTTQDGFTRYLLGCRGLLEPTTIGARRVFERLFREYGLPLIIRTDNGTPFASHALGRLSSLSVWWVRLGIFPELIEPASPHQNGRHERMHRTLKRATAIPPAPNLRAQQQRFDRFRHDFNCERPHEALGQRLPSELYSASARPYPTRLPPLVYPAHYEVRLVSNNGGTVGETNASPSVTCSRSNTSVWRKSTTAAGPSTSGPSSWAGLKKGRCVSSITAAGGTAGHCQLCPPTNLSAMSPTAHST